MTIGHGCTLLIFTSLCMLRTGWKVDETDTADLAMVNGKVSCGPATESSEIERSSTTTLIDFDRPATLMQRRPILIAHRGGVVDDTSPECSTTAIRKAAEQGYDMVELDVRMSADGIPVVFHDRTLKDACGRPESVGDLVANELTKITYLNSKDRVQTLDQALQQCRELRLGVMLDLKAGRDQQAFLERISKRLQKHKLVQATISFSGSDTARRILQDVRFTPTDDELKRVRAGENVDLKKRFWFGLPSQIDATTLKRLKASGALILPAINTFRYEASNHLEAAERDVLRLMEEGADGFQIDSVYGSFFDKLKR